MEKPVMIGSIVFSLAGRDAGMYYVVSEIVDEKYVKIIDGKLHRLATPKLKKLKHLRNTGEVSEKLRDKLVTEAIIYDAEVFSALRRFNA